MAAFLHAMDGLFGWVLAASWRASLAVVLVLVVRWVLGGRLAPRWRQALWLVVLARMVLPWSAPSRLSIYNLFAPTSLAPVATGQAFLPARSGLAARSASARLAVGQIGPLSWQTWAASCWAAGALALAGYLAATTWNLRRRVRRLRPLTEPFVLELLEECQREMGVKRTVPIIETSAVRGPCLFGVLHPRLLSPKGLCGGFSPTELRHVFLHEVSHLKRRDVAFNVLSSIPLALHWFNPLAWCALNRMRLDEELACDALALSGARAEERRAYGETIIKLLESFGRSSRAPGVAGLSLGGSDMKHRIRLIANGRGPSGLPFLAASAAILLAVATLTDAEPRWPAGMRSQPAQTTLRPEPSRTIPPAPNAPPRVIATTPRIGQTGVDPGLKAITVTFDHAMSPTFSWTGALDRFPPGRPGGKPSWRGKRTCVLPVRLQPGRYYRVGVNSESHRGFRSVGGVPAALSVIYFCTRGAGGAVEKKLVRPVVVAAVPANGAKDVDPALRELRVSFNVPMGRGCSCLLAGASAPGTPDGGVPYWTDDRRTCVVPVELEPGKEYRMRLNGPSHNNFQSAAGVPLEPVLYTFRTRN